MTAVLAFFTSALGRYVLIGLAVLIMLAAIGQGVYSAGVKHERVQTQKVQGKLDACVINYNALGKVVKDQNAALKAQSDTDAKTLDSSRTVTAVTLKRQPKVDAKVKHVTLKPTGPTLLDRYESVDKHVLEAIR